MASKPINKILPLSNIVFDEKLYPRHKYSWQTSYEYSQQMKGGAIFPPLVVASLNNHYILVDGKHRYEAYKSNKEENIQVIIISVKDEKELYLKAVEYNLHHGQKLFAIDRAKIISDLQKFGVSNEQISKLIHMKVENVQQFKTDRIYTDIKTGQEVFLKSHLKGLSSREDLDSDTVKSIQEGHGGMRQDVLLNQVCDIIENKLIDANPRVQKAYERLQELIKEELQSRRGVSI